MNRVEAQLVGNDLETQHAASLQGLRLDDYFFGSLRQKLSDFQQNDLFGLTLEQFLFHLELQVEEVLSPDYFKLFASARFVVLDQI